MLGFHTLHIGQRYILVMLAVIMEEQDGEIMKEYVLFQGKFALVLIMSKI